MGVFFSLSLSPVSSWVLTKWPHARGRELWPLACLWTGAGRCRLPPVFYFLLLFFFIFCWLYPGAATLLPFTNPKPPNMHMTKQLRAHNSAPPPPPSASRQHSSSQTITISSFLASLFTQSCEGSFFVRNIGWDSFTKCTLYVFSKASRKTRALISVPTSADSLLSVFLFLPHHHFHVLFFYFLLFLESHIIMQCYKSFKNGTYQAGSETWETAVTPPAHRLLYFVGILYREGGWSV